MCLRERRAVTLPLDLHEEILHRLRSKDLLNFKLVCRDWEGLISSPEFIKKHLERSKAECHEPRILVPCFDVAEILDCADIDTTRTIPFALAAFNLEASLLGSCDGLVLYHDTYEEKIGALNPSTGKYEEREPNPSMEDDITHRGLICSWFGHHPSTGEYVLVLANLYESEAESNKPKRVMFDVHALSRNDKDSSLLSSSTRELDWDTYQHIGNLSETFKAQKLGWDSFYLNVGTLLQGRLHCPVSLSSSINGEIEILVYDFETKEITQMSTPLKHCHALGVADGYLCAIEWCRLWVMKEYGDKESWTKYANILSQW